jgi:8-oxo-dGTP pyrophosphatase MutT (NUDIX family)
VTQPIVRAAGGVVHRDGARGVEVLLVHRPRYDDWTFPKGKLDAGEREEDAAIREVREETGVHGVLGRELPTTRYVDSSGRPKTVRYWVMTPVGDAEPFHPNREIDELRWCAPAEAAGLLTYPHDRTVLDAFDAGSDP